MPLLGNIRSWVYVAFGWTDATPTSSGRETCDLEQQRMQERRSRLQQLRTETAKLKSPVKSLDELESRVLAAKNTWAEATEEREE